MRQMRERFIRKEVFKAETEKKSKSPKRAKSAKIMEERIKDYFEVYLKESGEVADIEALADYLEMTRDELISMMNDRKLGKTLRLARNRIAKIKKQLAFGGKIPAAVLSFDLKNNHGYRDKPEDGENNNEQVVFKGKTADWAK